MGQPRPFPHFVGRLRSWLALNGVANTDPAAPPSQPLGAGETALADWQRYAAELERALDDPARSAPAPVVRYEIGVAEETHGERGERRDFGFALEPGGKSGPLVTVIVPVYEDVEMTVACLRSLAEYPPARARCEYVLVDDASPSEVASQLVSLAGLTVLRNGENLGFLRSCNRAVRLSAADYVVLLNNDTLVRPGWLDELVDTAERDPRVGVVGAKLVYPDGRLQEAGGLIWSDASGWNYGRGARADDPRFEYVRDVDYCSGAALLVRRSLWTQLGGFDERYAPAYFEDTDLCFAARRAGFRVVYQPRAVVVHLEGGSSGTELEHGVKRHQALNQPKFQRKWSAVLESEHAPNDPRVAEAMARRLQGSQTVVMFDNYVPEPDRDSGSKRRMQIIRLLRELGWHVIFIPDNDNPSAPYTHDLQQLGVEVVYGTPHGAPFKARVRAALELADVVWVARPDVFGNVRAHLDAFPELPLVYDTIDLHYVRVARELKLRADASEDDWRKQREMKDEELELARAADVTVAITEIEQGILESEGIDNVHVVPNIHVPAGRGVPFAQRAGIIFIGGYAHTPNVDAVEWLVREIMPLVWERESRLHVSLLGSNPTERVRALAQDPRVTVTGFLADVAPYFESARVFVSPLRFGAGLKGKIGQALEHGLPVVTTSIGAEGFAFADGRDALIADDAAGFAAAVVRLYRDESLWKQLADSSAARLAPYLPERAKDLIAGVLADAQSRHRARRQTAAV